MDAQALQQQQQQQQHDDSGAAASTAAHDDAAAPPPPPPGATVRCFSEETPADGRVDFQVVDLGGGSSGALYVWVGVGAPKLGSLTLSVESRAAGATPATATLVRGPASASGTALGQRLALRLKRPVLCACNIPADATLLQAFAERRLLQELSSLAPPPPPQQQQQSTDEHPTANGGPPPAAG